ncbi:MAG: dephospho-CoA kinase [Xanthomonadales bacterium]|nr:dephospho-CoA kinase [Xanthomonadales bacterium]
MSVKPQVFTVALTGGIASGKSTLADCFATLGVRVLDADVAARDAVAPGTAGLAEIVQAFGAQVLDANGALDRARMRQRVFDDADARRTLEGIIHPRVRQRLREAVDQATSAYVVLAIPLLTETWPAYAWVDRVLVIDVALSTQIERLVQRDGIDRPLALRMLASQASRAQRLALADDIIDNEGDVKRLPAKVAALHRHYLELAAKPES